MRYIGTGDILRDAIRRGTEHGKQAEPFIKQGHLVPDALVNDLVQDLFCGPDRPESFVADGYPRTVAQAIWFDQLMASQGTPLDAVIQFEVSDEEVVRRISGRRVSLTSGAVYHMQDRPPKVAGICDIDGKPLSQRSDDREEVIRERLRVFHLNTDDLVAHYRANGLLRVVPAVGTVDSIYQNMMSLLTNRA